MIFHINFSAFLGWADTSSRLLTQAEHSVIEGELPMVFLLVMCSMLENTWGAIGLFKLQFSIVLYGINISDFLSNNTWAWKGFQLQIPWGQRLNTRSHHFKFGLFIQPRSKYPKLWSPEVQCRNLIFHSQPGFLHQRNFIDWLQGLFLWKSRWKGKQGPGSEWHGLGRSVCPIYFSQLPLRPLWPFYHQCEIYARVRFDLTGFMKLV